MTQYGTEKNGARCADFRPRLKEIDKLFDIAFNYDTELYIVYFNGAPFQTVPWREMDGRTLETIRKVYWTNVNSDPMAEVDANNAKIDRAHEAKREDMVHELAKDMRKAILKEF